jgi:molecular chaperone GrpE
MDTVNEEKEILETEVVEDTEVVEEKSEKKKGIFNKKDKSAEEIIKLQEQLAQEMEKGLRIQAEMMNFKRRKEDEVATYKKYANEDILKRLVRVVDNFERALSMENEDNQEFLKGFKMIYTSILNILNDNGVVEIEAENKEFDPNYHQAVFTEHKD